MDVLHSRPAHAQPSPFFGIPRRRLTTYLLVALAICLPPLLCWYGINTMLYGYVHPPDRPPPDRAIFQWLQTTHATKRQVLIRKGGPTIRLQNPTKAELASLDRVIRTPSSTIEPRGDVWVYNNANVGYHPQTAATACVFFDERDRVYLVHFALFVPDLHGPVDPKVMEAAPRNADAEDEVSTP